MNALHSILKEAELLGSPKGLPDDMSPYNDSKDPELSNDKSEKNNTQTPDNTDDLSDNNPVLDEDIITEADTDDSKEKAEKQDDALRPLK